MSTHVETPSPALITDEKKEEKLAAAKQRLRQFKKESKQNNSSTTNNNKIDEQSHQFDQLDQLSGRSSPASSVHSFLHSTTSNNHSPNKQHQLPLINIQTNDYKDQQLQLHLQTIGILVAEKAELQSKLQQTSKKCDKKQEECDELSGRLKASRHKINELEKQIQNLNQNLTNQSVVDTSSINTNITNNDPNHQLNHLLIIDELRLRLNETNDKLVQKQLELNDLFQLNTDLTTQLELLNMKLAQFSSSTQQQQQETSSTNESIDNLKLELEESEKRAASLQAKNQTLQATVHDYEFKIKQQHDKLKQDYQQYVDQFKSQIESLVDQINRLTDEREASFSKIDKLEFLLKEAKKQNESLEVKLEEKNQQLDQQKQELTSKVTNSSSSSLLSSSREQLLENEIKYFKQTIESLVKESNESIDLLNEKEQTVLRLEKELKSYEMDRENQTKLIEQVHNDKQALSRALQQNKDLKDQLAELQDAFVNVTKQNLDLATQLESEKFKLNVKVEPDANKQMVEQQTNDEWNDESDESDTNNQVKIDNSNSDFNGSLMSGIRERLNELEKENKDLNDYITLMDENFKRNNDQQLTVINSQIKQIEALNQTINELNEDRVKLKQQLDACLLSNQFKTDNNNNSNRNRLELSDNNTLEFNEANFRNLLLLEKKFKKVMQENADLKEKIQELEHVISQLQFETETISDYINKYQIEREKLNKKYALKDETIRSLSTQLQVNRLALQEINNYFSAYIRVSSNNNTTSLEEDTEKDKKKSFILIQAQSLLNELTATSSNTLQNSMSSSSSSSTSSSPNSNGTSDVNSIKSNLTNNNRHHHHHNKQPELEIDSKSIQAFKSIVSVCPSCHGDLFVV